MFIDSRTLPKNKIIDTDVCIVGAGAAGITLAREFIGASFRVCLLESGGLEFDSDTQSLYQGENVGLPYFPLDVSRQRYFGGTTNHWDGWCRPLDPIDFEARDWIPYSGWPFDRSHIEPYYVRAQSLCRLGPFAYDAGDWESNQTPRIPFAGERVVTTIFQHSPPVRFGKAYRDEIEHAANISVYLYANLVGIETTSPSRTVTRLRVACLQDKTFRVAAKFYILAMGGIENARVLLSSNKVVNAGLGNENDLVGRFFMEHPHLEAGLMLPSVPDLSLALYESHRVKNTRISGVLSLSSETLRHEKIANFSALLQPRSEAEVSEGVTSLRVIYRAIRHWDMPDNFAGHLKNVITDFDEVAKAAFRRFTGQGDSPTGLISLYNRTEQVPNPDSRVTLADERGPLGMNRARLNWRLSPIDRRSIRRAHEIIGQELGRSGLGRFRLTLDDDDAAPLALLIGGAHHMGTTRMNTDPKRGVVNENCRVHGISNLFIAGSSVFPTSGYANPTLTIVALALRLADYVKGLIK